MISNSNKNGWLRLDFTRGSTFLCCSSARAFIAFTVLWSAIELPWELEATQSGMDTAALVFAKVLFIFVAMLTFMNVKWASTVYMVICALSILAISPWLLMELKNFRTAFALSAVEVVAKAGCLLTISGWLRKAFTTKDSVWKRCDFRRIKHGPSNF
jgi:hypothetical protein